MENKEELKKESPELEADNDYNSKIYFWKHLIITFFILIVTIIVCLGFMSYGFNLMSKPSTFCFVSGILLNAASVATIFFIFDHQLSKSKTLLRGKKFEEKNKN